MNGFIALHRKIRKSAVFNDLELYRLWSICLTEASHKEHQILVGRQQVTLQRGQFLTGRFDLHRMYNEGLKTKNFVSEKTVWRWLETLQKLENVTISSTNKFSIVTVVNWDLYQFDDQKIDQQMTNKRPTNDQQMTTNNNGNKGNNENNKDNADATASKRFIKPSLQQVIEYCQERNNSVDANKWFSHYEANGWKVGKNQMRDWKAAVRTWERSSTPSISESRTSIPNYSAKDREAELLQKAIQKSKSGQVSMVDFGPRTD